METLRKEALESELMQFIGTEHWHKHPLMPTMTYTDGVKYFAEQTESYWLLDVIATEYFPMLKDQPFYLLRWSLKMDLAQSLSKMAIVKN
ncbi:MAG: hypothetical protein Q8L15_09115 [Methylobacter sp.]|nr:hypothetical protein [Methylobacter sp.]